MTARSPTPVDIMARAIENSDAGPAMSGSGAADELARAALAALEGAGFVVVPRVDYVRLLDASEADDMIIRCETCDAWLDRDDPACASTECYTGCWKVATGREHDSHLCRSYRAVALERSAEEKAK